MQTLSERLPFVKVKLQLPITESLKFPNKLSYIRQNNCEGAKYRLLFRALQLWLLSLWPVNAVESFALQLTANRIRCTGNLISSPCFCLDTVVHVTQVLEVGGSVSLDGVTRVTKKVYHLWQVGVPPSLVCTNNKIFIQLSWFNSRESTPNVAVSFVTLREYCTALMWK